MNDTHIDTMLAGLDVAAAPLTDVENDRRIALRERIIDEEFAPSVTEVSHTKARRLPLRKRWLAAAGAAVTATAGGLAMSLASPAYAEWSAQPTPVTAHDQSVVLQQCRKEMSRDLQGDKVPPLSMSERRGDYVLLVFTDSPLTTTATCIATLPSGEAKANVVGSGFSSVVPDDGSSPFEPHPEGIAVADVGNDGDPPMTMLIGTVGESIRDLRIHTGNGHTVTPTIKNGQFVAIWPGNDYPHEHGEPEFVKSYQAVLKDGSVVEPVE